MDPASYFAAIDLGSNSFHMLIARENHGKLEVVDREKEMVQIARGLDDQGNLSPDSQIRALACLERFAERLRGIPSEHIRAVGTKTLRATNATNPTKQSQEFLHKAEIALGSPIQIISGFEEARLVYCGLAHTVTQDHKNRMVIDIGGGSTEFVIGQDDSPALLESLSLGCVSFTKAYFSDDRTLPQSLKIAYSSACSAIENIRRPYLAKGWELVYGTSGTMKAIAELVSKNDSSAIIYKDSINALYQKLMYGEGLDIKNLPAARQLVLPAGIVILKAIFDQLNLEQILISDATLKEGLIYDTIGRFSAHDSREETVSNLIQHYRIDPIQAKRVSQLALKFWDSVKPHAAHIHGVSRSKILKWAANLHEVGLCISHSGFHKHSYYLLRHSDLAGFGRYEQLILSNLVAHHRKKIPQSAFSELDTAAKSAIIPLLLCLRLAAQLSRRREDFIECCSLRYQQENESYILSISEQWLNDNPLTHEGLLVELRQFSNTGASFSLEFTDQLSKQLSEQNLEDNHR
ncbi:MAG: exopolyphosphatase/guanosine-5'-triphosphate,3'-diphosphate pyrophosphatase [Flavobacteriales bacterium]|jgi:exopolyphosphatase/guanosine-5'-triphosphate,3'-diphosphate pyrophosphatase